MNSDQTALCSLSGFIVFTFLIKLVWCVFAAGKIRGHFLDQTISRIRVKIKTILFLIIQRNVDVGDMSLCLYHVNMSSSDI